MSRRNKPASTTSESTSATSRRDDAGHDEPMGVSEQCSVPVAVPAAESIVSKSEFVSPKGNRYQVLHTDEHDSYDDSDTELVAERPNAAEGEGIEMSSAIIRFRSDDARQSFVADVQESWPELRERMYVPTRRPDAIVDQLSQDEMERLRKALGRKGKIFEDVKFEMMEPS